MLEIRCSRDDIRSISTVNPDLEGQRRISGARSLCCSQQSSSRQVQIHQSTGNKQPGRVLAQASVRKRHAEYPLAHGLPGQYIITSKAALSAIRRAPQLGQKPRRLQLKATKFSAWQVSHCTRRKPCSRRPHFKYSSNSWRT